MTNFQNNKKKKLLFQSTPNPSFDPPKAGRQEGRKNFLRKVEDFVCDNCGEKVTGDGYTDHCSKCLWGKHVDFEIPGDRLSDCQGLMRPVKAKLQTSNFKYKIEYKCTKCRHVFNVRQGKDDDRELLMELVK